MLSVADALSTILPHAKPLPPQVVPLSSESLGLLLAEDIASDIDMPPFDKALMDGFAVRAADLAAGQPLTIAQEIVAGQVPTDPIGPGQAARIMTGAPLPHGADAVVMVERTRTLDGNRVAIDDPAAKAGQHILPFGREMKRGDVVLATRAVLRPQEFGLLATVGKTAVRAFPRPRVAVISTGDEVIDPAMRPRPGQIRNSNGPMLVAQAARAGALPRFLGIARDRAEHLRSLVGEALETAVVTVLAGGVSMGQRDLVPDVLAQIGVTAHFHKVALKPGKPLLFGTRGDRLVFALPGNPVSAFVGFELFVRPAVRQMRGFAEPGPKVVPAVLDEDFAHSADRPTYHPARLGWRDATRIVRPVPWFGSPDLRALAQADALLQLPAGDHTFRAGQTLPVVLLEA